MAPKASKSMDMRFQWLKCRRAQSLFRYLWAKGVKNRADYPSKHHTATHHQAVRSSYVMDRFYHNECCSSSYLSRFIYLHQFLPHRH
eukprot:CCRYP_018993-RA/>CCRYP_018993-RA protein AED:0.64 eAED:0.64 QI:0/-1/0/1/-1/0/1/0/86